MARKNSKRSVKRKGMIGKTTEKIEQFKKNVKQNRVILFKSVVYLNIFTHN